VLAEGAHWLARETVAEGALDKPVHRQGAHRVGVGVVDAHVAGHQDRRVRHVGRPAEKRLSHLREVAGAQRSTCNRNERLFVLSQTNDD